MCECVAEFSIKVLYKNFQVLISTIFIDMSMSLDFYRPKGYGLIHVDPLLPLLEKWLQPNSQLIDVSEQSQGPVAWSCVKVPTLAFHFQECGQTSVPWRASLHTHVCGYDPLACGYHGHTEHLSLSNSTPQPKKKARPQNDHSLPIHCNRPYVTGRGLCLLLTLP